MGHLHDHTFEIRISCRPKRCYMKTLLISAALKSCCLFGWNCPLKNSHKLSTQLWQWVPHQTTICKISHPTTPLECNLYCLIWTELNGEVEHICTLPPAPHLRGKKCEKFHSHFLIHNWWRFELNSIFNYKSCTAFQSVNQRKSTVLQQNNYWGFLVKFQIQPMHSILLKRFHEAWIFCQFLLILIASKIFLWKSKDEFK